MNGSERFSPLDAVGRDGIPLRGFIEVSEEPEVEAESNNQTHKYLPNDPIESLKVNYRIASTDFVKLYILAEEKLISDFDNEIGKRFIWPLFIILFSALLSLSGAISGSTPLASVAGLGGGLALIIYNSISNYRFRLLAKSFIEIRHTQFKNQAFNVETVQRQGEIIMDKLREEARSLISNSGNNVQINVESPHARQVLNFGQQTDIADLMALIISFARNSGNKDAEEISIKLAKEAAKPDSDKSKILEYWTLLVSYIPTIKNVVDIFTGITKLLV